MYAGYLADLNGSLVNDIGEFHWDFETSLNGNVSFTHAAVLSGSRHCVLSVLRGYCRYVILQDTQAGTRRNTHPLTPILIIGHPLSTSSIYYDPQHHLCSVYVLDSPLWDWNRDNQHLSPGPLGLGPSTSYSMHFFTESSSSFRSICPYQRNLFCCNTSAMSFIPTV